MNKEILQDLTQAMVALRTKRNDLLHDSDWTQLVDSPLITTKKALWKTYRQVLRDLPNNIGTKHPDDIEFPTRPKG